MIRTSLVSTLVFVALALSIAGCGGGGLTADGHAQVTTGTGASATTSGFVFGGPMRLNGAAGIVTGTCQLSRTAPGSYGVVIDLFGNTQAAGRSIRSMTVMARSATPTTGRITADLGGNEFASAAGACTVNITSVDEGRGNVTLTATACPLAFGSETATVDVALGMSGCTVM